MPHKFEHALGARPHRHLPGIEFAPFAAHRHQRQEWKTEDLGQRQHVHAIADPARLHQQDAALAAGPGAANSATPSSSVVSGTARIEGAPSTRSISCECPASGTYGTWRTSKRCKIAKMSSGQEAIASVQSRRRHQCGRAFSFPVG